MFGAIIFGATKRREELNFSNSGWVHVEAVSEIIEPTSDQCRLEAVVTYHCLIDFVLAE